MDNASLPGRHNDPHTPADTAHRARLPRNHPSPEPAGPTPVRSTRRGFGTFLRLGFLLLVLCVARLSDVTTALYQGFLLADFITWILALGFEATWRKTLSLLEGIGYVFLFWLLCHLRDGPWLPEEPSLLGMSFLSFLLFFLGKTLWWSHRNLGSE